MPQSQALCQQLATKIQRYSMRWLNVCKVSCLLIKAEEGIQLVTGLRVNMKNKLMPFYDKMMLRKRYIIETINDLLKNTAQIVHSRHRSVANFIINSHATRESRMVFYHHYLSYLYTPFIYGNVICQCI